MPEPEETPETLLELARTALVHWNLDSAQLALHMHKENAVFRVEAPEGDVYALRIHRDGYHDLEALKAEHTWTLHLARSGLFVPEAMVTREGEPYAVVPFPASSVTRHVGVVRWISGTSLSQKIQETTDPTRLAHYFEQLGTLVAEFHDSSAHWSPPAGFRRHARDAEGLAGEKPFWGRFWEIGSVTDEQRAQLSSLRNALLEKFSSLDQCPEVYGMIHADLHADNVLVDNEQLSVIDFDDSGFGWYMYDLAVALHLELDTFHPKNPHFKLVSDALLAAYESKRPLPEAQRELLPWFLMVRSLELLRWIEDRPASGLEQSIPFFMQHASESAEQLGIS